MNPVVYTLKIPFIHWIANLFLFYVVYCQTFSMDKARFMQYMLVYVKMNAFMHTVDA